MMVTIGKFPIRLSVAILDFLSNVRGALGFGILDHTKIREFLFTGLAGVLALR